MGIPSITSIEPAVGLTSGQTFVSIIGTNMRLPPEPPAVGPTDGVLPVTAEALFGGEKAARVAVRNDPTNPPDGTILMCLTPPHAPGAFDVTIRNLDAAGEPIAGEEAVSPAAFTFQRADLTVESDLTRLVRTLLRAIKAQVLQNLSITVHTDFDDTPEDGLQITTVSQLPALVLVGPELEENRFYSLNEAPEDGGGDGPVLPFTTRRVPYTVDLTFELIGMSSHTVELLNFMNECTKFFHNNKSVGMDRDPWDPTKGRVAFEMDYAPGGQFKIHNRPNESNVRHFTGSFVVRGFDLDESQGVVVEEARTTESVTLDITQTGTM